MKRAVLLSALLATGLSVTQAQAQATISGIGAVNAIATGNDFSADLAKAFGYTQQATRYTDITINRPSRISFYALGAESSFTNSFVFQNIEFIEQNEGFSTNRLIGSTIVKAGSLQGLTFSSDRGTGPAEFNSDAIALFLPKEFTASNYSSNWLVFGFDDGYGHKSRSDYDDLIIGAYISAVPEPYGWAMMITGFGLIGCHYRRTRKMKAATVRAV